MTSRSGYARRVGRVIAAAAVLLATVVAEVHAAQLRGPLERGSVSAAFESVSRVARTVDVQPDEWFPVRGVIEFGEGDARFGASRGGRLHEGQDVFADPGTPLVAVRAGVVVEKGDDGGRGNYLAIWSDTARRTSVYLHMLRPGPLREGDRVAAGERIGAVGCTGSCWGDHLHLELRRGRGTTGAPLDPMPLLRRLARRAR